MEKREIKLATKNQVVEELELAYQELVYVGVGDDISDRDYWMTRIKILSTALSTADDTDLLDRIATLQERIDEIAKAKPGTNVTPIRSRKAAR